jgi:hypothetical protein
MEQKNTSQFDIPALGICLLFAAGTRLIPHVDNFTPMEAVSLFGAAYFSRKWWAFLAPVLIMYITDFVINNTVARPFFPQTEGIIWFSNYMIYNTLAYIGITILGITFLQKVTASRVVVLSLISSVLFFLITNFGTWMSEISMYPRSFSGLMMSYAAGLPFFRTSVLSTLVFSVMMFGSFFILKRYIYNTSAFVR